MENIKLSPYLRSIGKNLKSSAASLPICRLKTQFGIGLVLSHRPFIGRFPAWALPIAGRTRGTTPYRSAGLLPSDRIDRGFRLRGHVPAPGDFHHGREDKRIVNPSNNGGTNTTLALIGTLHAGTVGAPIRQERPGGSSEVITLKNRNFVLGKAYQGQNRLQQLTEARDGAVYSQNDKKLLAAASSAYTSKGGSHPPTADRFSIWTTNGSEMSDAQKTRSSLKTPHQIHSHERLRGRLAHGDESTRRSNGNHKHENITPFSSTHGSPARTTAADGDDSQSFVGELYLDGSILGTWITRYIERVISRPSVGTTGLNVRSAAPWPGSPLPT
jgi:hypothetical protein